MTGKLGQTKGFPCLVDVTFSENFVSILKQLVLISKSTYTLKNVKDLFSSTGSVRVALKSGTLLYFRKKTEISAKIKTTVNKQVCLNFSVSFFTNFSRVQRLIVFLWIACSIV